MTQPRLEVVAEWYQILESIDGAYVPSWDYCKNYLADKKISAEKAEDVALAMQASLLYEPKVDKDTGEITPRWVYQGNGGRRAYVDLWAVFPTWCRGRQRSPANRSKGNVHYAAHGLATSGKYQLRR